MINYRTKCLFRAASIIETFDMWPDELVAIDDENGRIVVFQWNKEIPDDFFEKYKNQEITIEPISFRKTYFDLKEMMFRKKDEREKKNERKND